MLTARKQCFVDEYIRDLNATQAAIRAGYARRSANQTAARLMAEPEVSAAIEDAKVARGERTLIDADYVLERLVREATADLADLYDDRTGDLLPVSEWPLIWRQGLVAGVEIEALFQGQGESRVQVGNVRKIRLSDRIRRLELIGKHVAVNAFQEQVAVTVLDGLADRLARARARAQEREERSRAIDVGPAPPAPSALEIAPAQRLPDVSLPVPRASIAPPQGDETASPPAFYQPIAKKPAPRPFGGSKRTDP